MNGATQITSRTLRNRKPLPAALAIILAFVSTVFTAGPGAGAEKENWENIVKAAKQEGKVAIYGGDNLRPAVKAAEAIFFKRYGIKIEYLPGRSREIHERILTEVRTGKHIADAVNSGGTSLPALWQDGAIEGWLPPSLGVVRPQVLESFGVPQMPIMPVFINVRGILINTKLVPSGTEPKSWIDVTEPKWRGKILTDDPRSAGAGNSFFVSTIRYPGLGKTFHQKLAQNKLILVGAGNYQQIATRVAQGEYPIGFPVDAFWIVQLKGAAVKWIAPKEGVTYTINGIAPVKGALRPNAAKVFIDFTASEEFQKIIGKTTAPVRKGVGSAQPEWSLDHVKLLPRPETESAKERDELYRLAESIYGIR